MSFQAKRELLAQVGPRYREANKKQKSIILNEFITSTGYARKYAIRLLSMPAIPEIKKIKRPRERFYDESVQEALIIAWAASNYIASKRLAPFLAEFIPCLERHGHLDLNEITRSQLISISPATIDRILKPYRSKKPDLCTTKPGKLRKHKIPVRTFADWEDTIPGFFEADCVAHCGWSMEGSFLYTLVLTDIATGWVECLPLLHRSKEAVIQALDQARKLLPFPILGIDTDNGTEFINSDLYDYCEQKKITFTRGRAYKKNDQCFVEQKNGIVVRQIVGYDRFEGIHAYKQLMELYRAVRLYFNFFQPSMKLNYKCRNGSKQKRTYLPAKTPFQRLKNSGCFENETIQKMCSIHQALDPVRLLKQIQCMQDALWHHATSSKQFQMPIDMDAKDEHLLKFQNIPMENFQKDDDQSTKKPLEIRKNRLYRKTRKPKVNRWWRTRKDPFESAWNEICKWLENNPEKTATSILFELQKKYPGKYKDGQLRTLQRRVQTWRKNTIITFNESWINEDLKAKVGAHWELNAIMEEKFRNEEKSCETI
jgi:hypothetical protein